MATKRKRKPAKTGRVVVRVVSDPPEFSHDTLTWGVRIGEIDLTENYHDDKKEAVSFAASICRAIASFGALSQLVVHGEDGKIVEERTYPSKSDPRRRKG